MALGNLGGLIFMALFIPTLFNKKTLFILTLFTNNTNVIHNIHTIHSIINFLIFEFPPNENETNGDPFHMLSIKTELDHTYE